MSYIKRQNSSIVVLLYNFRGSLFQANSFVDMSGIRMQTVSVRSEELSFSGLMLLRWVEYFLGPVSLYMAMNDTSHIDITLPDIGTGSL